jgi:hypothetical protein
MVNVSKENKVYPFRKSLQTLTGQFETENLVQRGTQLDPAMGCDLELKSNTLAAAPPKFLRIRCQGEDSYPTPTPTLIPFECFMT